MIYENSYDMIGNTPLLKIPESVHGIKGLKVYAKLEMMNPYGSIKDRIAKQMLLPHISKVKKKGMTVLESSSGNTAKALAILCSMNGVPFKTITNRIKVSHIRDSLNLLGADVTELPGYAECPDPTNPESPQALIEKMEDSEPETYFHTDQYFNEDNIKAHESSGDEINSDLGDIDYIFADLGTCGSSIGIGRRLREVQKKKVSVEGVITSEGGYVPGGRNENELFETGFFDKDFYDNIIKDSTESAIKGMSELHSKVGLLCGPTTGLVYSALKRRFMEKKPKKGQIAVFIACDRMEPYMDYIKRYSSKNFEEDSQDLKDYKEVDPSEVDLKRDLVIDIRSNFAFRMSHIEGSINLPKHLLEEMVSSGPSLPDKRIVIVCPVGSKSRNLSALLRRQGYDSYNLKGGLKAWMSEGFKVVSSDACLC